VRILLAFFILSGLPVCFGAARRPRQIKTVCPAPYYGLGNGDGVLDRRCFELQTQLSLAAFRGQTTKIKSLLHRGANADSYAGDRLPPLYWAASEGHTTAARLLFENGANPNRKYSLNGTPLFGAVYANHIGVVALLISHGADVNIHNGDETCLKIARSKGFIEVARLLQNAGARSKTIRRLVARRLCLTAAEQIVGPERQKRVSHQA
jgi:ankyrin repeat protein